jgi:hypothetical protein
MAERAMADCKKIICAKKINAEIDLMVRPTHDLFIEEQALQHQLQRKSRR